MEDYPLGFQVAEVELVYRSTVKPSERPVVLTAADAYQLFLKIWDVEKMELAEHFKAIFLNRASKVLGYINASTGGINGTVADVRHIFAAAIKMNACSVIVCHNHPSGSLKPSRLDEGLTIRFAEVGRILDIELFDHLIITSEGYYSFLEQGAV
jgi:DNA repair protein RadC